MTRLPLAAFLWACAGVLAAPASADHNMPGMHNEPGNGSAPAHPAQNAAAPAPVHLAATTKMLTNMEGQLGFEGLRLHEGNWADREATLRTLDQLRQAAGKTENEKFRGISIATVDRLRQDIAADDGFRAPPRELEKIPKMLTAQITRDAFLNGRSPEELTKDERRVYADLENRYGELMRPVHAGGPGPAPGDVAHADGASPGAGRTRAPGSVEPGGGKPLMYRFHDAYDGAVQEWENGHQGPPEPAPPPPGGANPPASGPGDPPPPANPGSGHWSGLPSGDHLGQMIQDDPKSGDAWRLSALDKLGRGDFSGALSDARRAVDLGGGAEAHVAAGKALYGLGDYPGAHDAARAALDADRGNKSAQFLLQETAGRGSARDASAASAASSGGGWSAGDRSAAMSLVNASASQLSAAQAEREARNAMRLGDFSGALGYLARALALNPGNAELYALRAIALSRQRDYAGALETARRGLTLDPKNANLLKVKGLAEVRTKRWKEARETADAMLALDPNDPYGYAYRAAAEGGMGDREGMLADLRRAAQLDGHFSGSLKQAQGVQFPSDQDVLFLFPGEPARAAHAPPAPASRRFGLIVGGSVAGGLLLALALLQTVLSPLRDKLSTMFTRRGPSLGAAPAVASSGPAGLIRGQYEISKRIGAGGMGEVFEGTDKSLDRRVAIKKMRDELRSDPRERARFVTEAKTVAQLHHPNIVDIYAIADDGGDVFLVFEYVDGKTVHDLVRSAGRLDPVQAAKITRAAADALEFAHKHGVIHRDMKPSNVMVDTKGRIKVMDFGIARLAKDSATRYSMTNTVVGTPPYMAPEQEQGQVRRESDVYALAVCAYEMLTGELPFAGMGGGMLLNKINMSYIRPSAQAKGLPESLDEVFAKAFQADPDKRWRTPVEFATALEAALPAAARA